jgi:hypothetical protein
MVRALAPVHTALQGPGFPVAGYELQVINSSRPVTGNAYVERKMTASVVIIDDGAQPPDITRLTNAKAAGAKIAFTSGDTTSIDPARLKRRLQAIRATKLSWYDLWLPDNN